MSIFIPSKSDFAELQGNIGNGSIVSVANYLGYHIDQVHTYLGSRNHYSGIIDIAFEIFTNNILFITTKTAVTKIDKNSLDDFLINYDVKSEFSSYKAQDILRTGIESKSLKINYLARVLNIEDPEPDGLFFVQSLDLNLFFIDGYLVDIQSSDGLGEWAKYWKEEIADFFNGYEQFIRLFWGNNTPMVIKELNKQADAWASIPHGMKNEFIPLHRSPFGMINFFMLNICHYKKTISLHEFLEVNHGRYKEVISSFGQSLIAIKKYKLDKFTYEFLDTGILFRYYIND